MKYTVKQLSKVSGVSVRTLHWYDKINLLKPSYYGENNYRYYEEKQLLRLQQILFFRELGFKLSDINTALSQSNFDNIKTLEKHKSTLENKIKRLKKLIMSVEKTVLHLKGKNTINLEEIFEGFSEKKQKFYEDYLLEKGVEKIHLEESKKRTKNWSKEKWLSHKHDCDKVHEDLIEAIKNGLSPESGIVQDIVGNHFEITSRLWTPDRKSYAALGDLYGAHPDFVKFYDDLDPKLLKFLQSAMKIYASKNLL